MRARWRGFLSTLGVAGALLTLVEPRRRVALLRLAALLAPWIGRRSGIGPRSTFLFAAGRLLDSSEPVRGGGDAPPSLVRLLAEAIATVVRRALAGRGRWGLRD
jgi:hypothetical protein